jgi:Ni/Co efflux regulator RcnB
MKRLIASIVALGLVATPALAATAPTAKPTNASLMQHKKGKAGAKVTKASVKTSKGNSKSN